MVVTILPSNIEIYLVLKAFLNSSSRLRDTESGLSFDKSGLCMLISFQILQVFMSIASLQTTVSCLAVTWLRRGRCDTGQKSPCPGEPRVSRRPAPSAQCHSQRVLRASSSSYLTTSTEVPRLEKCCSVLLKLLQPNIGDIFMT